MSVSLSNADAAPQLDFIPPDLYHAYTDWSRDEFAATPTRGRFMHELTQRGFPVTRTTGGRRCRQDIALADQ